MRDLGCYVSVAGREVPVESVDWIEPVNSKVVVAHLLDGGRVALNLFGKPLTEVQVALFTLDFYEKRGGDWGANDEPIHGSLLREAADVMSGAVVR
jgi:hypothetical protein